jgi:hypothetical protein
MNTTKKKFDVTPFNPCREGLEYYSSKASFEDFWRGCARGDWMLWMAAMLHVDARLLTKAAAMCANTVRRLMRDERSAAAVDAALRYANGEVGEDELREHSLAAKAAAADGAIYAIYAADANAPDVATYAAAVAAYNATRYAAAIHVNAGKIAADVAASVAAEAADAEAADAEAEAIRAEAYAGDILDDTTAEAKAANQLQTANICREVLTEAALEKVEQLQGEQKSPA